MDESVAAWAKGIEKNAIDIWRESLTQLRQLHGDVWNGVRFFLTVNGVVVAGVAALMRLDSASLGITCLSVFTAAIGIAVTLVALFILKRHREYYTQMLLRKTLLERALGFWDMKIQGIALAFPWWVDGKFHEEMLQDPTKWVRAQLFRSGTISYWLRTTYFSAIGVHVLLIIIIVLRYVWLAPPSCP